MSKNNLAGRIREYETIYILKPNVSTEGAKKVSGRVSEVVERFEGKLVKVDNWGRRKLAYDIQKFSRGVFVYVKYVCSGETITELERNLRLLDEVLIFQTVKLTESSNIESVEVNPEEVQFLDVEEELEEQEETSMEQRLGMMQRERPRDSYDRRDSADGNEEDSEGKDSKAAEGSDAEGNSEKESPAAAKTSDEKSADASDESAEIKDESAEKKEDES